MKMRKTRHHLLKRPPASGTESFPGFTLTSNIPQTGLWSEVVTPDCQDAFDAEDDNALWVKAALKGFDALKKVLKQMSIPWSF